MKRFTLFFVCLFLSIGAVMAQQKIVSGVVISAEDNQPVIGASVVAKGFAGVGAQTDIDGKFSFNAPSAATTIVVSYMGMQSREVAITSNMRIVLQPDSKLLEEVVVTGYGNVRKSSFTGSATTISSKTMKDIPTAKLEDKLSGAIAGLNISQNSGQPGGTGYP
ncbi:TonB-linked outer membrane protein, SusC/RagA family [Porphyromonas macacae]|uniref:TonB-linked outer membrane protein, SusC/RagA family n=1 Tax=Porphyromonas macacae TaxID=28115 RepID=A0A379EC72_9PORP|nr:carboxypeptidase-like regulatory domain-containing protein [Porphyromonas macacae]SUB93771.1 TonB-linked outer membrane protein, SusC/RagA family [Porphyromonas macacae]